MSDLTGGASAALYFLRARRAESMVTSESLGHQIAIGEIAHTRYEEGSVIEIAESAVIAGAAELLAAHDKNSDLLSDAIMKIRALL